MLAVFKKELRAYFTSMTGYIFMASFLFFTGLFFTLLNLGGGSPNFNNVLSNIQFIFLLAVPMLTMRLIAEEAKQKTDQLLLTSPLPLRDIVVGKYLAAVSVFLGALVITFLYPMIMSTMGEIAWSEIIGGYIGFFLFGCALIAVGLFISSVTENQVVAAVLTFTALLVLWLIDAIIQGLPIDRTSGIFFAGALVVALAAVIYFTTKNIYVSAGTSLVGLVAILAAYIFKPAFYDGLMPRVFQWFSLYSRYGEFDMGVLSLSPMVYYITFSSAFVFLTIRMLEKKRWS